MAKTLQLLMRAVIKSCPVYCWGEYPVIALLVIENQSSYATDRMASQRPADSVPMAAYPAVRHVLVDQHRLFVDGWVWVALAAAG